MNEKMISLDQIHEDLKKTLKGVDLEIESWWIYKCESISWSDSPKSVKITQVNWEFLKIDFHRFYNQEKTLSGPLTKRFYQSIKHYIVGFIQGKGIFNEIPDTGFKIAPDDNIDIIKYRIDHKKDYHHKPSNHYIAYDRNDSEDKVESPTVKSLIGKPDRIDDLGSEIWYFDNEKQIDILRRAIDYSTISRRRNEKQMKKIEILKETRIPGTNIILENKDKVFVEATPDSTRIGSLLLGKKFNVVTSSNARGSFTEYNKLISPGRYINIFVYRDEDLVEIHSGNSNWFKFTKKDFIKNFKTIYRYLIYGYDANLAHDFPGSSRSFYAL